jgi:hypothetical protein
MEATYLQDEYEYSWARIGMWAGKAAIFLV